MLPVAQFHPIAVHFPIVYFLTLAVFDAILLVRRKPISERGYSPSISASLALLAGFSALATFLTGDMAYDIAIAGKVSAETLEAHESLGTWTAFFIMAWAAVRGFLWWRRTAAEGGLKTAIVAVEIAGSILIIVAAYFGGQLVYELGVNVTRAAVGG